MNNPKGKLVAIGGAEDKGTDLETGEIHRNNLNFFGLGILKRIVEDITAGKTTPEDKIGAITNYIKHHPYSTFSDDDGGIINQYSQNSKKAPHKEKMDPFTEKVPFNEWVEISDKGVINEDLAVWFGKKKKPKGSSQPKGPWVDICRKVDGKHPPCGRQDTSKGSYPKCRAAGVAGKMSDSAKRSACQRKRSAEKNDTQSGKGQKPIMVSNK